MLRKSYVMLQQGRTFLHDKLLTYLLTDSQYAMIGDSIVSNFTLHYPSMWEQHFPTVLNLGIPGDRVETLWWRMVNGGIPQNVKWVIIHIGTNNVIGGDSHSIICSIVSMMRDLIPSFLLQLFSLFHPAQT